MVKAETGDYIAQILDRNESVITECKENSHYAAEISAKDAARITGASKWRILRVMKTSDDFTNK